MDSFYFPIIDNGGGMSRTRWGASMFAAGIFGVLGGRKVTVNTISCPEPAAAMNYATHSFLENRADRMIVIDTDVLFQPNDLKLLISHDLPLVAGLYPKKVTKLEWPVIFLPDQTADIAFDKNASHLVEVEAVARGFINIHRSVFDALKPSIPVVPSSATNTDLSLYWRSIPGGMSEDYAFCYQYRDLGGKVFVDQRIRTRHEGSIIYPLESSL